MSRRKLSPKEHRMWSRVAKSIKPIEDRDIPPEPEASVPEIPEAERTETPKRMHGRTHATSEDLEKLIGGYTSPRNTENIRDKKNSVSPKAGTPADRGREKKVRRGKVPFGSTLDLHGHTQVSGRVILLQFVAWHRSQGETSVLVITGKGRDGEGVLKRRFLEWIAEPDLRTHVSGYARANQKHGGDGAFYLFLKRVSA